MSTRRTVGWNLALVTVQAGLVLWAHAVGVSWTALGLLFAGLALAAGVGLAYFFRVYIPRAHLRYQRRLRVALAERAQLVQGSSVNRPARPALPGTPTQPSASNREAAA